MIGGDDDVAHMVSYGCVGRCVRRDAHDLPRRTATGARRHDGGPGKHDLVNCRQRSDAAIRRGHRRRSRVHGNPMISEIEILHLMDADEAEFPEAALLAACLVRRGWASKMPAKYQALVADFISHGIVSNERTEVDEKMKPKIRVIIEDGQPTVVESIGCPIQITVWDKTSNTTAMYSTHEGVSHPVPLLAFDEGEQVDPEEEEGAEDDAH